MLVIKRIQLIFLAFLVLSIFGFQLAPVFAYDFEVHSGLGDTGYAAGYDEANLTEMTVAEVTGKMIGQVLLYVGVFFLLLTIYAGFIWMFSRGNEQEVEKAKKILQNALIGLIVVLLAYAITYLVLSTLTSVQYAGTDV